MSFTTLHRSVGDQGLKSADSRTCLAFSSNSSHTDCSTCTDPESDSEFSSIGRTLSECPTCLDESDDVAGCCRFLAKSEERQPLPGCMDPDCAEINCNECSDHEEWCDDCVVDCGSDCGMFNSCDELDIRVGDTYSFEGSHSELFGDQTAQTFGFGRRLPQLVIENTITESSGIRKMLDDTALPPFAGHVKNQSSPGSRLQQNLSLHMALAPHTQLSSPEVTTPGRSINRSASQGITSHERTPAGISPPTRTDPSLVSSSDSTHGNQDPTESTSSAHYDHINLLTETGDSETPFAPSLRCQWTDQNGEPCGETLKLGNDMHEHLKSAHGVKYEVFCRWVGCPVGVHISSPHKFASSVERHTWGHSEYRPYKCPTCNEGFAAASVRDEHFTNIHLRKKIFSCDMCSHQCTSGTNLKRHKDDKHSAERYQCEFCNRTGRRRLFPRGPNLARHFRNCKNVLAQFPEAAAAGTLKTDWLPPGYKRGHHGMDRARVTPPNYLPAQNTA